MIKSPEVKIIAGMPAYNEAKYIGTLILQARQYVDEVIVVDDGSTDNTSQIAELAGATVIRHETNQGKGVAVQRILAEANEKTADILVLLDADSQHNPAEMPSLIFAVLEGSDLVIGSRIMDKSNIPLYRRAGQKVLSYFTGTLSKGEVSDTESGFRALSRKCMSEIQLKEQGFAVEAEMISDATHRGLIVKEVPISAIYTQNGSTLHPVRHGFGVLNRILVMISERRPLLFFGLVGGIFVLVGIAAGVVVVQSYFYGSQELATGTALISILCITVGILCIFTGLILNVLIKRISDHF